MSEREQTSEGYTIQSILGEKVGTESDDRGDKAMDHSFALCPLVRRSARPLLRTVIVLVVAQRQYTF